MRCVALAQALAEPVRFYIDPPYVWRPYLVGLGFQAVEEKIKDRAATLLADLAAGAVAAAVFDGYIFPEENRCEVAKRGFLAEIVDEPGPTFGHAVVSPGLAGQASDFCGSATEFLIGGQFALLRATYAEAHRRASERNSPAECRHLLVQFGAFDSQNATAFVVDALATLAPRPHITVVIGSRAPALAALRARAADMGNVDILTDVDDMASIYERCDLAIGAAGVSLLERMCCGLPSIVLTLAPNQIANAVGAASHGAAEYCGPLERISKEKILETAKDLIGQLNRREQLRRNGLALIDGRGAARVAQRLQAQAAGYGHTSSYC
jgi:hypothetical protein